MNEPTSANAWREVLARLARWAGAAPELRAVLLADLHAREPALPSCLATNAATAKSRALDRRG